MELDFEEEAAIRIAPLAIDPFIFFTVPTGFSQNQIESVLFDACFSCVDALGVIFVVILEGISDPIMDSGYQIAHIFVWLEGYSACEFLFVAVRVLKGEEFCVGDQAAMIELGFDAAHSGGEAAVTIVAVIIASFRCAAMS